MIRHLFDQVGGPVLMAVFALLFAAESIWALRRRTQPKTKRLVINFLLSLPAFGLLRLAFIPAMVYLAMRNESWHFGLTYLFKAPAWAEAVLAFLLLDYTNYCWHLLNHKIPVLWRFHLVHHTDRDLDVSTAIRFHFGEIIGSLLFRGAAVLLTGASPVLVLIYEIVFEAATQFHHSNLRLPVRLEQAINRIFVTPRMHGIHHSVFREETDSNYSVIFSWWDRLHRTARLDAVRQAVTIGVPAYHDPQELTIGYLLGLPFTRIREWDRQYVKRGEKKQEQPPSTKGMA